MSGQKQTDQPDPARENTSRKRAPVLAFVGRPRVIFGPEGAQVQFRIANRGPVSVDVAFDVNLNGQAIVVENPRLSLGGNSGEHALTLDLPLNTDVGRSPKVTVTAKSSSGHTLAVGTGGAVITSAPVVIGGVVALSLAGGIGFVAWPNPDELGGGDVQFTLRWSEPVDLDLHVIGPSGEEISFGSRRSASGGQLDVDACAAGCEEGPFVENIFWPDGEAPQGEYLVFVEHYRGSAPAEYELTALIVGQSPQQIIGELEPDQRTQRFAFGL